MRTILKTRTEPAMVGPTTPKQVPYFDGSVNLHRPSQVHYETSTKPRHQGRCLYSPFLFFENTSFHPSIQSAHISTIQNSTSRQVPCFCTHRFKSLPLRYSVGVVFFRSIRDRWRSIDGSDMQEVEATPKTGVVGFRR